MAYIIQDTLMCCAVERCGSTQLYEVFDPRTIRHYYDKTDNPLALELFCFMFVRNPLERYVSAFQYSLSQGDVDTWENYWHKTKRWVPDQYKSIPEGVTPHYIALLSEFDHVMEVLKKKFPEVPQNDMRGRRYNASLRDSEKFWGEYFTPEMRRKVEKRFEKDFELYESVSKCTIEEAIDR